MAVVLQSEKVRGQLCKYLGRQCPEGMHPQGRCGLRPELEDSVAGAGVVGRDKVGVGAEGCDLDRERDQELGLHPTCCRKP